MGERFDSDSGCLGGSDVERRKEGMMHVGEGKTKEVGFGCSGCSLLGSPSLFSPMGMMADVLTSTF